MMQSFFRNKTEFKKMEKDITITVIGIGRGVGTTTVASTLAYCFAEVGERVNFLEASDPQSVNTLLYWQVAMDQRFFTRNFVDFYKSAMSDKSMSDLINIENGINWMIITPENRREKVKLKAEEKSRLLIKAMRQNTVIDLTYGTGWDNILPDSDIIVAVLEPTPSKLLTNDEVCRKIKEFEARGKTVIWVVNKITKNIQKHKVRRHIGGGKIFWLDFIEYSVICDNERKCEFPGENMELYSKIKGVFTEISHCSTI